MRHMKPRRHTTPVRPSRIRAKMATAGVLVLISSWPIAARIMAAGEAAQRTDAVTIEQLLERAGAYVLGFEMRFSNVVTEERYVQESTGAVAPSVMIPSNRVGGLTTPPSQPNVRRRE